MKKLMSFITLFVLMFILVGCGGSGEKEEKTQPGSKYAPYLTSAVTKYKNADTGSLKITVTDGDTVSTTELAFEYTTAKLSLAKLYMKNDTETITVIDNLAYISLNGNKYKTNIAAVEATAILEDCTVEKFLTSSLFGITDNFFSACTCTTDKDGVAEIKWDSTKYDYSTDVEGVDDFEVLTAYENLSASKEITMKLTYANNEATKLEINILNKDSITGSIVIEFLGLTVPTIEAPTDASAYEELK